MPSTNANKIEKSNLFNTLFAEAEKRDEFHAAGVKIEIAEQIFRMMKKGTSPRLILPENLAKIELTFQEFLKGIPTSQ